MLLFKFEPILKTSLAIINNGRPFSSWKLTRRKIVNFRLDRLIWFFLSNKSEDDLVPWLTSPVKFVWEPDRFDVLIEISFKDESIKLEKCFDELISIGLSIRKLSRSSINSLGFPTSMFLKFFILYASNFPVIDDCFWLLKLSKKCHYVKFKEI